MSVYKLTAIQHGLEATAGTAVPATFKWAGEGELEFEDHVEQPAYMTNEAGYTVEDTFVSATGSTLRLKDTEASAEILAYLCNMGVKAAVGPASTFAFTFPTTAVNTLRYFTWELATSVQEYEFAYGFAESFSIHGDTMANNGRVQLNAIIKGRKAAASTLTASLGFVANHQPLNLNNATIKFDAVGTAAGTAAATSGYLRGFSMDVKTGWSAGMYADGRSALDFAVAEGGGGGYEITGNLKCLLSATGVTEIANSRAGTGRVVQIALNGTASRLVKLNLPLIYTAAPQIGGTVENGLIMVSFPFKAGYARTVTAAGPEINITTSSLLTIT